MMRIALFKYFINRRSFVLLLSIFLLCISSISFGQSYNEIPEDIIKFYDDVESTKERLKGDIEDARRLLGLKQKQYEDLKKRLEVMQKLGAPVSEARGKLSTLGTEIRELGGQISSDNDLLKVYERAGAQLNASLHQDDNLERLKDYKTYWDGEELRLIGEDDAANLRLEDIKKKIGELEVKKSSFRAMPNKPPEFKLIEKELEQLYATRRQLILFVEENHEKLAAAQGKLSGFNQRIQAIEGNWSPQRFFGSVRLNIQRLQSLISKKAGATISSALGRRFASRRGIIRLPFPQISSPTTGVTLTPPDTPIPEGPIKDVYPLRSLPRSVEIAELRPFVKPATLPAPLSPAPSLGAQLSSGIYRSLDNRFLLLFLPIMYHESTVSAVLTGSEAKRFNELESELKATYTCLVWKLAQLDQQYDLRGDVSERSTAIQDWARLLNRFLLNPELSEQLANLSREELENYIPRTPPTTATPRGESQSYICGQSVDVLVANFDQKREEMSELLIDFQKKLRDRVGPPAPSQVELKPGILNWMNYHWLNPVRDLIGRNL